MSEGLTGAIIERHADGRHEGAYCSVRIDFLMLHDPALALMLHDLKAQAAPIHDKNRLLLTIDHFAPASTIERANLVKEVLAFAEQQRLPHCLVHQGICHQLLVEGPWVVPGMLVVGSDSHTTTAGALGCVATGMGSTDMLYCMVTGKTWLHSPAATRINFNGELPPHSMGKDIILALLGTAGEAGFFYQALEFYDVNGHILMDDRFAICNMVVDAGAKNGLFFPDAVTRSYLEERDGKSDECLWAHEEDIGYSSSIDIDLASMAPKIARPHSPANVTDVAEAQGEPIQQVFIGSCTGGRLHDLEMAARVLNGKTVAPKTRLLVAPASQRIYRQAIDRGYVQAIMDAGGVMLNPSCGPCGGIDKGILAAGEACLSTSNRNFQGRMGDPASRVYLASALTAAATALRGKITDPREVL